MPGIGPGIHELARGDAETRRRERLHTSAPPRLRVSIFFLNSWMPGPSPGMTMERLFAPATEASYGPRTGSVARGSCVEAYVSAYGRKPGSIAPPARPWEKSNGATTPRLMIVGRAGGTMDPGFRRGDGLGRDSKQLDLRLHRRQRRRAPAAAERLDQRDAGGEAVAADRQCRLLVVERRRLGDDHRGVGHRAGPVLVE